MSSKTLLGVGTASLIASFGIPNAGIPLLLTAIGCFVAGEAALRHEEKFIRPVRQRKYAAWLQSLDAGYEYEAGVQQALAQNRIDWQTRRLNQQINTAETINEKYFNLFTAGRQQSMPPQVTIPVEHQAVEEPQPEQGVDFSGAADLPESWDGQEAQFPQAGPTADFPVEDIAELIARNSTDRDNCGSILIACPKGTGKSNLLRAAIFKLHQLTEGAAQITVFNGKEDRDQAGAITSTFCGLEKDSRRYINAGDPGQIEAVHNRLEQITNLMESNHSIPMVQILDEYNNQLIAATIFTSVLKDQQAELPAAERQPVPDLFNKIKLGTTLRITKGRSKLVADWITSHSPLVQDVGLNTMLQQSLTMVILGRGDKLDAIHTALNGKQSIVKNPQLRAALYEQFLRWEQTNNDPYKVVCLTNLAGRWRLCLLPKYPDVQPEIAVASTTNEAQEAVAVDAEIVDEQSTPATEEELVTILLDWIQFLGRIPSDAELSAKLRVLLDVVPTNEMLVGVKYLLRQAGVDFEEMDCKPSPD